MIDTIHFRIHDLEIHEHLKDFLLKKYKSGTTRKRMEVDTETGEIFFKNKFVYQYLTYQDTGNQQIVNHSNDLKSSHYNIKYKIDIPKDCIEVNVSLPKYFFGTNVFQLVPHLMDNAYVDYYQVEHFKLIKPIYFEQFLKLFKNFVRVNFPETDFRFLQIYRIDLCFNQVFNSKEDAEEYLNIIRAKEKKFARVDGSKKVHYDTSFMEYGRDKSQKVYHKGPEFQKNDLKELRKLNEEFGYEYFNLRAIQRLADRTLRYEMTLRDSFLYRRYLFGFEFKSRTYKTAYSHYNKFKKNPLKISAIKEVMVRKQVKEDIRKIDKILNTKRNFYIGKCLGDIQVTDDVFKLWFQTFVEFVDHYQSRNDQEQLFNMKQMLSDMKSLKYVKTLLGAERKNRTMVNKSKVLMILNMMEAQNLTLDEIKKSKLIPKTTFYRYASFLKRYGIDNNSSFSYQPNFTVDFQNYYQFCNSNFSSLKNLVSLPR